MLDTLTVKELKYGDYFQFAGGQRINKVYFVECNEVFYTNILSKLNRKIKIKVNPERRVIMLTQMFEGYFDERSEIHPF